MFSFCWNDPLLGSGPEKGPHTEHYKQDKAWTYFSQQSVAIRSPGLGFSDCVVNSTLFCPVYNCDWHFFFHYRLICRLQIANRAVMFFLGKGWGLTGLQSSWRHAPVGTQWRPNWCWWRPKTPKGGMGKMWQKSLTVPMQMESLLSTRWDNFYSWGYIEIIGRWDEWGIHLFVFLSSHSCEQNSSWRPWRNFFKYGICLYLYR